MPAWLWALYLASFRPLVVQCSTSVLSDEPWRPTVSKSIQKSANRSKWRHAEHVLRWRRRLQETTTLSTQTFPGFNTKRSELCVGQGQSVLQEERPLSSTSLSLCSYCRGPDIDPCIYDVSECFGISQGSSCRVRCKAPYLGASSIALCPASGISGEEANLSFRLPNCVAALEQDKVSCPNPATIPSGYLQVQETGQWTCRDGYYGEAVRECTLLRVGDACVLQAVFSGCLPLLPCRRPDPASDFQDAVSDVPSCGFNTSGCENVQPGASCQIHCQEPFMGNSVTAACPSTNTDPDAQLIYTQPQCQKRCPSSAIQEVGPGYNYDFDRDRWSCAEGFTGQAVKLCEIDDQCGRNVSLTGCAELRPCQAPTLDSCRYDWSSCGDLAPGTSCRIACRTPFEGEGFPATCWANNSDPMAPLNFEVPWCNLNCPDPLPLPEGYTRQATGYRCDVGYTGIVDRSCSVVPEDCSWEVTMTGCDKLVSCKALPEPEDRCQFDVEDCQRPVPLGQSCETRCREPYIGLSSQSKCPTRNTDPERTVDFLPPSCAVPDCPEPVPRGYAKTENGWQCAPGYGGTVLSSCTTCGRLVLRGCTPAIPCKPVEVEDPCRYNTTDCSTPIGVDSAREKYLGKDDAPKPPPAAPGAYQVFVQEKRPTLQSAGKNLGEVAKEMSQMWGNYSEEDRKPYEQRAAELKAEYEDKMKEYKQSEAYKKFERARNAIFKKPKAKKEAKAKTAKKPKKAKQTKRKAKAKAKAKGKAKAKARGRGKKQASASDSDVMGSDSDSDSDSSSSDSD